MTNSLSTLKRTPDELRHLEQKKAQLGIPPAIEFWPKVAKRTNDTEGDVVPSQKDTYLLINTLL